MTVPRPALRGSYTPLVTPFRDSAVDFEEFERLVARQVAQGSSGIVVTGTTGEPTSLTVEEREELCRRAVAAAGAQIEVVAATGSPNQEETLRLCAAAESEGADALLVVVPAFVKPSQEGIVRHFLTVAERTELPVIIYNIPGRTATGVTAETVERIASKCPNVAGLKHASTDLDIVTELLVRLGDEFRLFCGTESLSYPMLAIGASGVMSAVGNLFPDRLARLCGAVFEGDHATALTMHRDLFALNHAIFFDTNPVPLKHMLARLGICSPEVRPPLAQLGDATRTRVDQVFDRYLPEVVR